jgi:hypothetical protein
MCYVASGTFVLRKPTVLSIKHETPEVHVRDVHIGVGGFGGHLDEFSTIPERSS